MKPNDRGGMTYEGAEIPMVIAAASHQNPDFGDWLRNTAAYQLEKQQMSTAGVDLYDFDAWKRFKYMDRSTLEVTPELALGARNTTMTYGHITETLDAGLFPRQLRPIARGILIEAGLVEPSKRERVARALRAVF